MKRSRRSAGRIKYNLTQRYGERRVHSSALSAHLSKLRPKSGGRNEFAANARRRVSASLSGRPGSGVGGSAAGRHRRVSSADQGYGRQAAARSSQPRRRETARHGTPRIALFLQGVCWAPRSTQGDGLRLGPDRPGVPSYQQAVEFGQRVAEAGFMVITGAASGIMEAGHVGAGRENSHRRQHPACRSSNPPTRSSPAIKS